MVKIDIVGTGDVGLTTGAPFVSRGNHVTCINNNKKVLATLRRGEVHFFEPKHNIDKEGKSTFNWFKERKESL